MGQIANDMINGTCCELCGCYFEDPKEDKIFTHGYPAVCWDCWSDLSKEEKENHQKATVETF